MTGQFGIVAETSFVLVGALATNLLSPLTWSVVVVPENAERIIALSVPVPFESNAKHPVKSQFPAVKLNEVILVRTPFDSVMADPMGTTELKTCPI